MFSPAGLEKPHGTQCLRNAPFLGSFNVRILWIPRRKATCETDVIGKSASRVGERWIPQRMSCWRLE